MMALQCCLVDVHIISWEVKMRRMIRGFTLGLVFGLYSLVVLDIFLYGFSNQKDDYDQQSITMDFQQPDS